MELNTNVNKNELIEIIRILEEINKSRPYVNGNSTVINNQRMVIPYKDNVKFLESKVRGEIVSNSNNGEAYIKVIDINSPFNGFIIPYHYGENSPCYIEQIPNHYYDDNNELSHKYTKKYITNSLLDLQKGRIIKFDIITGRSDEDLSQYEYIQGQNAHLDNTKMNEDLQKQDMYDGKDEDEREDELVEQNIMFHRYTNWLYSLFIV